MPVLQLPSVENSIQNGLREVELVPFGDHTLGHSTENGSTVLLNETARLMLKSYQNTGDKQLAVEQLSQMLEQDRSNVESDFDAMLLQWSNAGLFAGKHMAMLAGARLTDDCQWSNYVKLGNNKVHVRCNDAAAGSVLQRVLEPLLTYVQEDEIIGVVDLIEAEGSYLVAVNGQTYWSCEDFAGCRHMFLQAVLETSVGQGAVLHASAVRFGNSTLILSGASGSGKSTLMSQLVLAGGEYLGDDLVALSLCGESIFGLSTNISIKPGSNEILNRQLERLDKPLLPDADEYGLRYWQATPVQSWQKATHLCFPKFQSEMTGSRVQKLDPLAALNRLLEAGGRACGPDNSIRSLATLCQTIPAYSIQYGAGEDAMNFFQELMA